MPSVSHWSRMANSTKPSSNSVMPFACILTTAGLDTISPTLAPGRLEDAAAGFHELLVAHPEDDAAHQHLVQILKELGDSAASAGRTPRAVECYRELVTLEPRNP